ncbi:MAG: hypothetical protein HY973_03115 [Candidatus Kerfeldbacteria bacterium]|nr:hypothetical protein [Candidatus Kerfeldbacteria bacterium]
MAIVAAAILPHSPLLLPGLAKAVKSKVNKTNSAITILGQELYARQINRVILIASHNPSHELVNQFCLLQAASLPYRFNEFGDLKTSGTMRLDVAFTHRLKEAAETQFSLPLLSLKTLPYTFAVPWAVLHNYLNEAAAVCLQIPRTASFEDLRWLAGLLKDMASQDGSRVAVIAAGNLAHFNTKQDTAAKIFDQSFRQAVQDADVDKLLNLETKLRQQSQECLVNPAIFLYTLLEQYHFTTDILSYENELGVGLMVANLIINS